MHKRGGEEEREREGGERERERRDFFSFVLYTAFIIADSVYLHEIIRRRKRKTENFM